MYRRGISKVGTNVSHVFRNKSITFPQRHQILRSFSTAGEYVSFGFKTAYENEKLVVSKSSGKMVEITGPKRVLIVNSHVEKMKNVIASATQYLKISYLDGKEECLKGPIEFYFNPRTMKDVESLNAIDVKATEPIIVWNTFTGKTDIITGPIHYFPKVGDNISTTLYRTAKEEEYLQVIYKDGKIENISGPTNIIFNIFEHKEISKLKKINLTKMESLCVYNTTDGIEKGVILDGPLNYMPKPHELYVKMDNIIANSSQYIKIYHFDGKVEIVEGPTSMLFNSVKYKNMQIKDVISVNSDNAIIVFDKQKGYVKNEHKIIEGPYKYIPKNNEDCIIVEIKSAKLNQYLELVSLDGKVEHLTGPCQIVFNPYVYNTIEVKNTIMINGNESIVVYNEKGNTIQRKIIKGPTSYIPNVGEWLHEFSWHGASKDDPYSKKRDMLVFRKIKTNPNQMFYNMSGVRTKDDAMLSVKLAIFYEMTDIEKMLDNTSDLIAEMMNGSLSDITNFFSEKTYEQFKENIHKLNMIETFPRLVERATVIGFKINNVVFRGHETSNTIQIMYDKALEKKTQLQLEQLTEEQKQKLETYKLEAEASRSDIKHKLDKKIMDNENELKRLKFEGELKLDEQRRNFELDKMRNITNEKLRYMFGLKDKGVDLTEYLVAMEQRKPDKYLKIDGSDNNSNLHIHEHIEKN
jgi:hypothetical protein